MADSFKVIRVASSSNLALRVLPNRDLNGAVLYEMLSVGVDINSLIKESYTYLFLASLAGDRNLVKRLLDNGALIDKSSKNRETPLDVAVEMGYPDIVKYLLDRGATMFPSKLLNLACNHGHYNVVKVLLESIEPSKVGRAINPESGTSPLHLACKRGHIDIVKLLMSKGVNLCRHQEVITDKGPVFFWPKKNYRASCVQLRAFKWREVNWVLRNPYCRGIRYYQIFKNSFRGNKSKYESMVLDKTEELHSGTPLILAVHGGYNNIVSLLLNEGVRLQCCGVNPFKLARDRGHLNVFLTLFHKFMNINPVMEERLIQETLEAFSTYLYDFVGVSFEVCQGKPELIYFDSLSYFKYLKQHLKALKVVGLCNLVDDILPVDQEILDRCDAEIANMKSVRELNGASLFVVLHRYKNPYYLRNLKLYDSMSKYLRTEQAMIQFPLYYTILKNRFLMSKYRLSLLTSAADTLEGQDWWYRLPDPVRENILIHLENKNLQMISEN